MAALEIWRFGDRVMLRDPVTDHYREMDAVASVTFLDGTVFPSGAANKPGPERHFIKTLDGTELEFK